MKIVVAHPHRLMGDALSCVLTARNFDVIAVCQTQDQIIESVTGFSPEAVIISGLLVNRSSGEEIIALKQVSPSSGIIVVSSAPRSEELITLLEAGASGYVTVDSSPAQLADALHKVYAGEVVLCGVERKSMTIGQEFRPSFGVDAVTNGEGLTPREREVLGLLSQGLSNKRIAEKLFLSEHTVRTHVQNLRAKLNVRSKFEAAMWAMRSPDRSEAEAVGASMRF